MPYTKWKFITQEKSVHGSQYNYSKSEYTGSCLSLVITCLKHGDFTQRARNHLEGHGCPSCVNKTEGYVFEFIRNLYDSSILNFRPIWTTNPDTNYILPFDMVIKELKLIIEVDGDQHFKTVSCWKLPEVTQKRDIWKMKKALENGYSIIRIPQIPAFKGGPQFLENELAPLLKLYDIPEIIYITPAFYENIYDEHKNQMKISSSK